jgi:CPA1 family monovalent cation:H+ antiporter
MDNTGAAHRTVIAAPPSAGMIILVSLLAAYASYIVAESAHASGVLSVVTCGLIVGWRQHDTLSAQARTASNAVWSVATFALEAFVFVLIGLALRGVLSRFDPRGVDLQNGVIIALWVTGAVIVARLIWVFPATYLPRLIPAIRKRDPSPPAAAPLIIGWAGMRGVVSPAAALALPTGFPDRDLILLATFIVILITVLVQGTTLGPLIKALKFDSPGPVNASFLTEADARARVVASSLLSLEALVDPGSKQLLHPRLVEEYRSRARATSRLRDEGEKIAPLRTAHFRAALDALAAGRKELLCLHRAGKIHDSTLHNVEAELDIEELRLKRLGGFSTPYR